MTEAEWLECCDVEKMLEFLTVNHFNKASGRRNLLFSCACVRRVWHLLADSRSQQAVIFTERFAEGQGAEEEIAEASNLAWEAAEASSHFLPESASRAAALIATDRSWDAAWDGSEKAAITEMKERGDEVYSIARAAQCVLLRDIFGTLLFRSISLAPAYLTPKIVAMALAIYDERAFDRLPIMADALESAGCTDADILAHCRGPGPHVRGCWVVDHLLGKE